MEFFMIPTDELSLLEQLTSKSTRPTCFSPLAPQTQLEPHVHLVTITNYTWGTPSPGNPIHTARHNQTNNHGQSTATAASASAFAFC